MTFLVLLASIAVLEYLVGRKGLPADERKSSETVPDHRGEPTRGDDISASLNALQIAVDGRGKVPQPVETPQRQQH